MFPITIMSQKILTYMSGERGHAFFGALKFLQKRIPIEIYPIIDRSDRTKKFFKNQNFVNFKKIYFYRDSVKPLHSPDLRYLKKFEEKHKLNLWQIAFSDPTFYTFNGKSKFLEWEILSLIEDDCRFFEKVIEESNPDFLIIHVGGQKQLNLLENIAKSLKIKILKFAPARFGSRVQISKDYDVLDKLASEDSHYLNTEDFTDEYIQKLEKELDLADFYKNETPWGINLSKTEFFVETLKNYGLMQKEFKRLYSNYKNSNFILHSTSLVTNKIKKIIRKKFLDKNCLLKINEKEKFAYFPLQMQPEMTTSVLAPYYPDQISLVKNIAQSLPIGYYLYVKEHNSMGIFYNWRKISYYKQILDMPNVKLIHPRVKSSLLLQNCKIVLTINGSVSYEALFYKKPVIVFANTSTMTLPIVKKINNIEDLPQTIRYMLRKGFDESSCTNYFETKMRNSFTLKNSLFNDIFRTFYIGNTFVDDITISKMNSFLSRNNDQLKFLAEKFLTKIQQYEKGELLN